MCVCRCAVYMHVLICLYVCGCAYVWWMYTSVGICTLCCYKKGHHKSLVILFFDDYPRAVYWFVVCTYACLSVYVCVGGGGGGGCMYTSYGTVQVSHFFLGMGRGEFVVLHCWFCPFTKTVHLTQGWVIFCFCSHSPAYMHIHVVFLAVQADACWLQGLIYAASHRLL